jgi:hypothetical protein
METIKNIGQFDWLIVIIPLGVLVATLVVGWLIKLLLFRVLLKSTRKVGSSAATVVVEVLRRPFMIWIAIEKFKDNDTRGPK